MKAKLKTEHYVQLAFAVMSFFLGLYLWRIRFNECRELFPDASLFYCLS